MKHTSELREIVTMFSRRKNESQTSALGFELFDKLASGRAIRCWLPLKVCAYRVWHSIGNS